MMHKLLKLALLPWAVAAIVVTPATANPWAPTG